MLIRCFFSSLHKSLGSKCSVSQEGGAGGGLYFLSRKKGRPPSIENYFHWDLHKSLVRGREGAGAGGGGRADC